MSSDVQKYYDIITTVDRSDADGRRKRFSEISRQTFNNNNVIMEWRYIVLFWAAAYEFGNWSEIICTLEREGRIITTAGGAVRPNTS